MKRSIRLSALGVVLVAVAARGDGPKTEENLVGLWTCVDPKTGGDVMSFRLKQQGVLEEIPPNRLVGANGLGANRFSYEQDGFLSIRYVKAGRERVDDMLSGKVTWINRNEFTFKILGGYYGQSRKGQMLTFKRE